MEHAPRAARGGDAAVVLTLLIALVGAVEAAAVLLREAAGLAGNPLPTTKPRTGRVVRTPGRGLPAAGPVTGVPARPRPGQGPPDRPGPSRTR
ncbi:MULTISPECIES: hypothetical protein [unclassified Streptomyces]|uniref:hypothetical protein n=1 Tax=unclassified Streptomyces TaxID=2593676 RepID=UPI002E2A1E7A|nr:hypothetical protein [Streptomyces sp. NBC_01439]